MRALLALGLVLYRQELRAGVEVAEDAEPGTDRAGRRQARDEQSEDDRAKDEQAEHERAREDLDEHERGRHGQGDALLPAELTADDLADRFHRLLVHSAKAYLRSKMLTRLLNSEIRLASESAVLVVRDARVVWRGTGQSPPCTSELAWQSLDIRDYDRMSVLLQELRKIQRTGAAR